ncbi:MAG: penicillin-binding transpeptidase domain-containing protein [Dermatophilaceae bacterium]
MSRRVVIASVVAGVVVVASAAGGFAFVHQREQVRLDRAARASADKFASAWSHRTVKDVTYSGRTTEQVVASFKSTTSGLGSGPVKVTVTSLTRDGDKASGRVSVAWTVAEGSSWAYTMPVSLQRDSSEIWTVVAKDGASMWAPGLSPAAKLVAKRTWGTRGDVLDGKGSPIVSVGKVYDVSIDPARATAATVADLESVVQEPGKLVAKLAAAKASGSKAPIFVITYREADFQARKAQLDAIIGVIYPPREQPLALPSPTFARPLLGSYGLVTAEAIKNSKGLLVAGDYAGLSGLQGQYDGLLAGTPGVKVTASDKPDAPLFEKAAVNGTPMTLTLDPKVQSAAETALAGSGAVPSSLVAVDVKTGDLLAVANSPFFGMNRALQGQYQPGSTLKVATTYSLLGKGLTPSTPVTCPPFVMVDGRKMTNYENETFATAPFSKDFALSCNTAFVQLAAKMGDSDVHDAAAALGIGTGWGKHLGIDGTFSGSVPAATSKTEKAATAFGQAKTLVSPASLAVMVASVARGSYIEPALIRTPAVAGADRTPKALDAKVVAELRSLMRLVVTQGTGTAVKSAAGGAVFGKTGTAEYGSANPPETRAWFVGWQGDVAFAVLVENGKSGGTVAAPIAKTFLDSLQH